MNFGGRESAVVDLHVIDQTFETAIVSRNGRATDIQVSGMRQLIRQWSLVDEHTVFLGFLHPIGAGIRPDNMLPTCAGEWQKPNGGA